MRGPANAGPLVFLSRATQRSSTFGYIHSGMATTAPLPYDLDTPLGGLRFKDSADEELALLVAEASESAFAALYERHCQPLYRYCRSIVRDDVDAQDAFQTAWARALVALRRG